MFQQASTIQVSGQYRIKKYRTLPYLPILRRQMFAWGILNAPLISETGWIKNTVSTASGHGLNIIARRLTNDLTYDIICTQAKIGTGTTAPTAADTDLETVSLDGILVANQGVSGTQATLEFFIADGDLSNGTYTEFGIFAGDQLIARSLISPSYTKASNEDTTIEYLLTFSNA